MKVSSDSVFWHVWDSHQDSLCSCKTHAGNWHKELSLHYEFCKSTSWPIITLQCSQGSVWICFPLSTSVRQLLPDKTIFVFFLTNVKISVMKVISLVLHKQSFTKYICTVPFLCNKSISQITVMCKAAMCCFLQCCF